LGVVNPNLGEEEVVGGRGWYHSKGRQLVTSYKGHL